MFTCIKQLQNVKQHFNFARTKTFCNATRTRYGAKQLYNGSSYSSVDGKSIASAFSMKTHSIIQPIYLLSSNMWVAVCRKRLHYSYTYWIFLRKANRTKNRTGWCSLLSNNFRMQNSISTLQVHFRKHSQI